MSENTGSRIVYITAGAGGMYCGSCLRDNALAGALTEKGWDVTLLPLYTPIRVDGPDRSVDRVFFGGISVYLQQKIPLFRHLPAFLDRWLDNPKLIRRVASGSISVDAKELGEMTLSMVKGEDGYQRKEVRKLVEWLRHHAKPDLICLTNLLVGGSIPALKRELGIPVYVTLQGDDLFLDELKEPWKSEVIAAMKSLAAQADGFFTFSNHYRQVMSDLLDIPEEKFHIVPLGIRASEFDEVAEARRNQAPGPVIGYFARICPEKGFDLLVDAFLKVAPRHPEARLKVGGWLPEKDREFFEQQVKKLEDAGLGDRFDHVGSPDHEGKLSFFKDVGVFCVPARFIEPKGLYALEAKSCGIPVVAPDSGTFPEMIEASGGGVLFRHGDVDDLAEKLDALVSDLDGTHRKGWLGRQWVETKGTLEAMAEHTADVFRKALGGR